MKLREVPRSVRSWFTRKTKQVAQLSQRDRAAGEGGVSFGKNINRTSNLYPTAVTSTNHHFTVFVTLLVLNAKFCNIWALILEVFRDLTCFLYLGFFVFF